MREPLTWCQLIISVFLWLSPFTWQKVTKVTFAINPCHHILDYIRTEAADIVKNICVTLSPVVNTWEAVAAWNSFWWDDTYLVLEYVSAAKVLESHRQCLYWRQWKQWRYCSLLTGHWPSPPPPSLFHSLSLPPSLESGSVCEQPICEPSICTHKTSPHNYRDV